ncbi:ATP-binding cassette domain-containing protein [Jatrophihabitans sp. DSM 45814]
MVEAAALWASGLGVRYKRRWVFRNVAVSLPAGEIVRLSGTPGSGKSTLLRVLAGVTRPSAGTVRHRPPVISYVPSRFPAHSGVTTERYLRRLGELRGLSAKEAYDRADGVIDRFSLRAVVDLDLKELSAEDLARVAFAQSLLDRPSLLIVDDPWNDLKGTPLLVATAELKRLADVGCVIVFTDRSWRLRALEVDQHLSLSGGIIFPLPHESPSGEQTSMRLELYGTGEGFDHAVGIIDYRPHPDGLTVIAEHDRTNDLLRIALQNGWLIRRVEPNS